MSTTEPVDALETADAYPKYNDYEGSGVDWLGDIPAHWDTAKLKFLCDRSAVYGANRSADEYTQDGVRFLRTTDIDESGALTSEGVYIDPDSVENYMLEDGDLLLSRSGTVGRSFIYSSTKHDPCAYAGYLVRFVLDREKLSPEYAFYFTKTGNFYEWLRSNSIESTIGNVSGDKYANMPTVVPPPDEQRAIATFLDRETERIDALIEKKERLIDLLEEKRTALISRVVTEGLDRDVEMQDSGVEWLEEVPAGWDVARLKFLTEVQSGIAKGKRYDEDVETIELPYLRVANVQDGFLNLDEVSEIEVATDEVERYLLRAGDVLMTEGGDYDKLGRGTVWNGNIEPCLHQNHIFAVRPRSVESEWVALVTQARYAKHFFIVQSVQSTNLASISMSSLQDLPVVVPPRETRQAILDHVDRETERIDTLTRKVEAAIDRLKEYRTALISAAVTGQIDVREEVPAAPIE